MPKHNGLLKSSAESQFLVDDFRLLPDGGREDLVGAILLVRARSGWRSSLCEHGQAGDRATELGLAECPVVRHTAFPINRRLVTPSEGFGVIIIRSPSAHV